MASPELALRHAMAMETALRGYTAGSLDRSAFLDAYREAFRAYKANIDSPDFSPLADIADSHTLTAERLRALCRDALDRLPRELLDRSTRSWIADRLIHHDSFRFTDSGGASLFGQMRRLHSTPVASESFSLSALDRALAPAPFEYDALLRDLRTAAADEPATWALCTEPDNAFAHIDSLSSLDEAYGEPDRLAKLEPINGCDVQWGPCYLLLIPASRDWLLVNRYDFHTFEIELHGSVGMLDSVCDSLAIGTCAPTR